MRYQAGFHRVVPLCQVGCIRVTHPSAGRRQKYCYFRAAPRLACVKPVASVHPEPGSNSSLYIFFILFFIPDISCSYALIDDVDAVTSFLICFHISSRTYFVFAAYLYWFSPCFQ